ncbi:MAG: flavin reductase family protein [Prolixibacteraceae bacterium]|nr:flavin reductase family protein [Prolixibacteraceae bacterium]MBT6004983.1 flavin reductase family protein [Prolixibacteraceae bacterium]MBT6766296.1 flavin reductase family protein [Prolixibacteraceae bacterium]MBT6998034.1 flavin reductase family protein [Prolixibacteraceae bacterium]MBT7394750.1 flavin reductase family protein [Prolixibacteraceae bacterium]
MARTYWKPGTIIYPLPAVMVSCGENPEEYNIITIAWTGTINSDPPMCYISVRPGRHSYDIIKRTGEYVINLTTEKLAKATDWCGCRSGKKYNKWKEMNLTPAPAKIVKAPIIEESPVNIECVVKNIVELGSHHMFISEVVSVSVDDEYLNEQQAFSFSKANPLVYSHGHYFGMGKKIGKFGWSVEKKKKIKK